MQMGAKEFVSLRLDQWPYYNSEKLSMLLQVLWFDFLHCEPHTS